MLQQGESELNCLIVFLFSFLCQFTNLKQSVVYSCCFSLSVKDKAELLLQVEELLHIKEELSLQVCYGHIRIMREENGRVSYFIIYVNLNWLFSYLGRITTRCP